MVHRGTQRRQAPQQQAQVVTLQCGKVRVALRGLHMHRSGTVSGLHAQVWHSEWVASMWVWHFEGTESTCLGLRRETQAKALGTLSVSRKHVGGSPRAGLKQALGAVSRQKACGWGTVSGLQARAWRREQMASM